MNVSINKIYLAPLRGVTDSVFRAAFERHFGKFDYVLAPFIPTYRTDCIRDHHIKDLLPNTFDRARLIPQIIGNDANGFLLLAQKFADVGFLSVNWNLGCPMPLITKKKRGSGLLPHRDIIKRFLDDTVARLPVPLSIKVRLGLTRADELEKLMPIFNAYPLCEIIIHPRTGEQMYDGAIHLDVFETCLKMSAHTVVYNGDIRTVDDFKKLSARFPNVNRWMIGRGVVANPNLLCAIKGETPKPAQTLLLFLDEIFDACKKHSNQAGALGRMKEIWRYLCEGTFGDATLRDKIMRAQTIEEYNAIRSNIYKKL